VKAILSDEGVLTIYGEGDMDNYAVPQWDVGTVIPWVDNMGSDGSIKSIVIESGVTSIGDFAFFECINLTSVTIPNSVTTLGNGAFAYCTNLGSVTMGGNVKTISEGAFYDCESLISIVIPDSVIFISDVAFGACISLTSVTIPDSVTTLGNGAFAYCESLTSVTIPDKVTSIGNGTFVYCTNLEYIVIPDKVTSIGEDAFAYCTGLTSIVIPDSVTTIGDYAFYDCTGLTSVTVTGGLGGDGKPVAGGVIDKYFKNGTDWKLPGAPNAALSLTLKDIISSDYDPDNEDGKGGTAGDEGRELYYSNTKFTWNAGIQKWDVNTYTVTIAKETGVSGFGYTVIRDGSVICTEQYTEPFTVNHGDILTITALTYEEYAFVLWSAGEDSSVQDSKENPLTVQYVSGNISLEVSGELIEHYVTFGSGSDYTVYVNGSAVSSVSSAAGVTGGGILTFSVRTAEGYTAVPAIGGIANLTAQSDGSYRISEIYSNVRVTVTVTAGGNNSGGDNDSGNNSGNGNNSGTESDDSGIPYWIPILIAGMFLACIAAALIGYTFVKHRKG
jgi:hypothetical protein